MQFDCNVLGDGSPSNPYTPDLDLNYVTWENNGDGIGQVTLTDKAVRRVKAEAIQMATNLNVGTSWSTIKTVVGPSNPTIHKQMLAKNLSGDTYPIKKSWANATLPVDPSDPNQVSVFSHDNGTTRGLWRATAQTDAEPSQDSADWTLIFEV